jgi:3-methyladenine DNA glycosylase AlkD
MEMFGNGNTSGKQTINKLFYMKAKEIMDQLKSLGNPGIKKILLNHGVKEPFFGVKVADLKPIQKKIKKDYALAKELFATGNADAMYLAGLIADDEKMSKTDLNDWVKKAVSNNISEYTVPWVAAEGKHGFELALQWIESKEEYIAAAGWATLANLVALKDDAELDLKKLRSLLTQVEKSIHRSPNRVTYAKNGFVIALGAYVKELSAEAVATAKRIGQVTVNMDKTACKVPFAPDYIDKTIKRGGVGKKKKTVKC